MGAHRRETKPCRWCGHDFDARVADRAKYCSPACANRFNAANGRSCGIPWAECRGCDTWFVKRGRSSYCSPACRPAKRSDPRRCRWCDTTFVDPTGRLECSEEHRRAHHAYRYCPPFAHPITDYRDCAECGGLFPATPNRYRYCSPRCANRPASRADQYRRRRARRGSSRHVGVNDLAKRDGWNCHLCRRPIRTPHYRGRHGDPTIDHIVPVSEGGTDEPNNLALAHMICNSRRGNDGAAQLRLAVA